MKNLTTITLGISIFAGLLISFTNVYALEDRTKQTNDVDLIVLIKIEGGLCPYGDCYIEQKIFKNGIFQNVSGGGEEKKRNISLDEVNLLMNIIEKTDFQLIRSHRFAGMCPTDYDGSRLVFYFYTSHGVEEIDSCQHQIDESHPLFKELSNIIAVQTGHP